LEELEVAEIVNKCCCPTEAEVKRGAVVVLLVLNRLTVPPLVQGH